MESYLQNIWLVGLWLYPLQCVQVLLFGQDVGRPAILLCVAEMQQFCAFYSISHLNTICATNSCSKDGIMRRHIHLMQPSGPPLLVHKNNWSQAPFIHHSMPLHKTSSPRQPNEILIQLGTVHFSKRPFSHRLVLFSLPGMTSGPLL